MPDMLGFRNILGRTLFIPWANWLECVHPDRSCGRNPDVTAPRALRNFIAASGAPLETVWPVTSRTAARQLGIADRKGSLEAGKDADLVLLDSDLNVRLTMVGGQVVYQEE